MVWPIFGVDLIRQLGIRKIEATIRDGTTLAEVRRVGNSGAWDTAGKPDVTATALNGALSSLAGRTCDAV